MAPQPTPDVDRAEVVAAFERHHACQVANDWEGLADLFTDAAIYVDPIFGTVRGRDEIRTFLLRVMDDPGRWDFDHLWRVVDADRVVFAWHQRFAEPRPDGGWFEFGGLTVLRYAGDGLFSEQHDVYDASVARRVLREWGASRRGC